MEHGGDSLETIPGEIFRRSCDEFEFSVRVSNCLRDAGIETLAELIACGKIGLLQIPGFGSKSLQEVERVLYDLYPNLELGMVLPEEVREGIKNLAPSGSGLRMRQLVEIGAVVKDEHFVYASGRHGPAYFNKDAIYARPWFIEEFATQMANALRWRTIRLGTRGATVVAAPAGAGAILASRISVHLKAREHGQQGMYSVYAEKDGDCLVFRRGYGELIRNAEVLVIDDVLTTGRTAEKLIESVQESGGRVIAIAIMVNRGDQDRSFSVNSHYGPLFGSKIMYPYVFQSLPMEDWDPADCPLCQKHMPINTLLGHGRVYVAGHGQP